MEEDILYGKNRHFFGGIAPSNMRKFTAKFNSDGSILTITAELPLDTILDGQMVCCVGGAVIRKSNSHYPKDEFDGELVADIKSDSTFTINNSHEGITYLAAFPYSKQGVYNRNKANRTERDSRLPYTYLFGYDLDLDDPDPATRVSYPDEVYNYGFEPARMLTNEFTYGDWPNNPGDAFMPKPCMLKNDGTVGYYLNHNDYSKKEDGTTSDVANTSYDGNAMMEWPKIYTKRWEENGVYHFRCSDFKIDEDWDCWCNYDKNDNEIDHFYTAIYQGSAISTDGANRLRSISGAFAIAGTSYGMSAFSTYAKRNSEDYDIGLLVDRLLVNDLLVMITKTTDLQTAIGVGARTYGTVYDSGELDTKGLFWGSSKTGTVTDPVKVFGMENYWGNRIQFMLGWCADYGTQGFKFTYGKKDGSSNYGYNYIPSSGGYITSIIPAVTSNRSGYIKGCMSTKFGRIPYTNGGSATEYESDHLNLSTGSGVLTTGEVSDSYYTGGPFQCNPNASYNGNSNVGASLSCKPTRR